MRNLYLLAALLFAVLLTGTEARIFLTIDNFLDRPAPLILVVPADDNDEYWWSPYEGTYDAYQPGRLPKAGYQNFEGALGGQRDLVIGWEGATPAGSVAVITVANRQGSIAFPLGYAGGAYFQYDGDDFNGANAATTPFPGARLNALPGMGSHVNTTSYPERNSDGQTVDFTSAGRALGIYVGVVADHQVFYFFDALDKNEHFNTLQFQPPASEDTPTIFFFPYTTVRVNTADLNAWSLAPGTAANQFDWTRVAAFQVRIWTFQSSQGNNGSSDAVDSSFSFLNIFGYVITGNVQQDCECNGIGEGALQNVQMNIFRTTAPTTLLDTTLTDVNGDFSFAGSFMVHQASYNVCFNDLAADRCTPASGCFTVTLTNFQDPAKLQYFLTTAASLIPPQDRTVNCGDCTTTTCLGTATRVDCVGGSVPINTFSDARSGTCPVTIRRTFTDSGISVTQTITIVDNVSPVITTQASSVNIQCPGGTPTLNTWISTQGGAVATDCSSFTWTNNWDNQQITGCGAKTVTFTATDACANPGSSTTATYSIIDTQFPVVTTQAQAATAQCNANGSDFTALNTWLNSQGGAVASDNCGTVTWTNNYVTGTLTRGCANSVPVTFTASDRCGNTVTTQSTFSINDNSAPVITTQASNQNVECSSSNNQFNAWLSNNGGAVATDVCFGTTGLIWTNNFSGSAPNGCNGSSGSVTFSVTDNCAAGNTARTTATFTTTDTQAPVITTPASPLSIDCASGTSTQLNTWLSTNGGAVATDACTAVTWSNNFNSQTVNCASTPVTFTASDQCATPRTARTTANFSIVDNQAPTFSPAPTSATVECGPTAQASFTAWLNSNAGASVFDNCSSAQQITVTNDWPVGTLPAVNCLSTATVRFQATDPCQNRSPLATATFTISDTTPPTITTFASDRTVSCDSTSTSQYNSWVSTRGGAQATDCNAVTWSNNAPAQPSFNGCTGSTTVTFTARDSCALTSVTVATFTIQDDAAPTLTTPASDRQEECTGNNGSTGVNAWLSSRGGAVATDACSAVTWTNNFTSLTGGCVASATVTFTATDGCGRSVSTTATYTVSDTRGPVITTPAQNRVVPCNDETQSEAIDWVNSNGGAVASDSCAPQDITWTHSLYGEIIECDFATVTFTATDSCGLSSSTTATFTSVDNSAPTFSPPASDLSVECNGTGNIQSYSSWIASNGGAVALDECALSFTWTNNAPASGPVGCGIQTVTFTVTDNCNNSARTTATFRVIDTISPTIDPLPSDLIVACDGTGNTADLNAWTASRGGASAFDVCTAVPTWTVTPGSQTGSSCGLSRPYTFRAADACGNAATATANFIITDFDEPILTTPVEDVAFQCDGNGNVNNIQQWLNSNGGGVARDACQSSVVWDNDYPGSGPLSCSSILVTFTIDDGCGNTITDQALLTIADDIPPIFTEFPDDVTVTCDADVSVEALGSAIAVDTCAGAIVVGLQEFSEDEPPIGDCPGDHIITRRWTAADECGNLVTQDQIITVQIIRSSGPCDPEDCECDQCCPSPAASDCLPAPCNATPCIAAPCQASACTCPSTSSKMAEARGVDVQVPEDLIQPLPQCKPVYIYVNDDDDTNNGEVAADGAPTNQRMIVTNEPLHENAIKNKSPASTLTVSFLLVLLAVLSLF